MPKYFPAKQTKIFWVKKKLVKNLILGLKNFASRKKLFKNLFGPKNFGSKNRLSMEILGKKVRASLRF